MWFKVGEKRKRKASKQTSEKQDNRILHILDEEFETLLLKQEEQFI